jgi:hypothetical protein
LPVFLLQLWLLLEPRLFFSISLCFYLSFKCGLFFSFLLALPSASNFACFSVFALLSFSNLACSSTSALFFAGASNLAFSSASVFTLATAFDLTFSSA